MFIGYSLNVPLDEVYGDEATYPSSTKQITLNKDGSFVQHITIKGHSPVIVNGKCEFNATVKV